MSTPNDKGIIKAVSGKEKIDTSKAILISSQDVALIRRNKIENWPHLADVLVK